MKHFTPVLVCSAALLAQASADETAMAGAAPPAEAETVLAHQPDVAHVLQCNYLGYTTGYPADYITNKPRQGFLTGYDTDTFACYKLTNTTKQPLHLWLCDVLEYLVDGRWIDMESKGGVTCGLAYASRYLDIDLPAEDSLYFFLPANKKLIESVETRLNIYPSNELPRFKTEGKRAQPFVLDSSALPRHPSCYLLRHYFLEPPCEFAPSVEALSRLFYEKRPDQAGKKLIVQYSSEIAGMQQRTTSGGEWQELREDDTPRPGNAIRLLGKAHVNTQEFHERFLQHPGIKGGGSLEVLYDMSSGSIIRAKLTK